ncbi:hypothetical protein [Streptomyces umbrinus]|uniref:hypothetical protein n=1 Tax=Streptomyces umbrinus TaxID=67370 RepID=UPI00341BA1CD
MQAAWIGLAGAVAGAGIAGIVAWLLQRRKEAFDAKAKAQADRDAAVLALGAVRASAFRWIRFLHVAAEDAAAGRFLELSEFDERSDPLQNEFNVQTTSVRYPGAEHLFYSRFAETLRSIHGDVRRAIANRSSDQADAILARTDSFQWMLSGRREVTTKWINNVMNGRWITTNP